MKKITLLYLALLLSFTGFAQFTEGFESTAGPDALPSTNWTLGSGNWAVFDNGVGLAQRWKINTTAANVHGGTNAAYVQNENIGINNTSEDYLATPLITVPANGQLHFWTRTVQSGDQGTKYHVKVNTVNGTQTTAANYTTVQQWTETSLVTTYNVYEEKVVDLTAYAGQQVYIAFMMTFTQPSASLGGDRWLIDDVNLVQQCLTPTNIAVNALSTSATISWTDTNGATSWQVEVVPATSTLTGTGTVVTTNPYTITGLTANTSYICSVRALCSGTNISTWATTFTFSTTIAPVGCGGNYVDSGGTTGSYSNSESITTLICPTNNTDLVTVTFTAFSTESCCDHLLVYAGSNTSGTLLGTYSGTTLPPVLTSSTPGGCLTFVFNSDSSVTSTGWIANITCAPAPTCTAPTALAANSVLSTTAVLSWTQPQNPGGGTASAWEVIAVPCGSAAPTSSTTGWVAAPTNPFTITGLSPTTCYDFYAKAICSGTDSSSWSAVKATATTQALPPVCGGNYMDSGGISANYAVSENNTVTICPTNPGDQVTVTFTSFNTEATWDALYVFNGNSVSAPQIASTNGAGNVPGGLAGGYWGTTIPGPFTSSSPDGCLTFNFRSDSIITDPGWTANVTCAPAPTCAKPTSITASAVLSTTAVLSWTQPQNPGGGTASAWNVIALPCGSTAPTSTTTGWVAASTNPYTITGLSPNTCYDFYVEAVCSGTDSSPWSSVKATATTQSLPPVCGGNYVDSGGSSGSYSNSESITTTICPDLNTNLVTVTFTAFSTESCCDHLLVYDGTGTSGTLLGTYSGTTIPPVLTSSTPGGCLTFVFNSDSSVTSTGWIANITCAPAPTCSKPTGLTATTVLSTSATLSWTQPQNPNGSTASAWQVIALPCGSAIPAANATGWVSASTNPFTMTSLSSGTCYDFYVRAVCSASDSSDWSVKVTASTQVAPPVCGGIYVDSGGTGGNYSNNENTTTTIMPNAGQVVVVDFTSFNIENGFDHLLVYDGPNASSPLLGNYTGTTLPPELIGSSACGCLTFVFTSDSSVSSTGWLANVSCVTAPTCPKPLSLTTSGETQTSVTLSWTDSGSATSWQVYAVPCVGAGPLPTTVGTVVTSSPYTITGLTPNTCYNFYVRGVCSPTDSSFWYGPSSTTTLAPPPPSCVNSTPAGDTCDIASNICNLNGYCGNTSASYAATTDWPELTTAFCGSDDNDSFLTFTASSSTVSLNVWVTSSTDNLGIQIMIFSAATCGSGPVTSYTCWNPFGSQTLSLNTPYNVTATGLTPGQTYYMLIDGYAGDDCNYVIAAGSGVVTTVNCSSSNGPAICLGQTTTLTASGGNGAFTWTPATGLSTTAGGTTVFTPSAPGTYTFTATSSDGNVNCPQSFSGTYTVTVNPTVTTTFNPIAPICTGDVAPVLPTTSIEGVAGTWTPPTVSNTATGTYTFTPTSVASCAPTGSLTVTVNNSIVPAFDPINPICIGATAPILPATSTNGVTGTWAPPTVDTSVAGTVIHTFTPSTGSCTTTATLSVTVMGQITPTFTQVPNLCQNSVAPILPTTSSNGVIGTWAPSTIDTSVIGSTQHTFTPDTTISGQSCAVPTTMTVTVTGQLVPTFNPIASICQNAVAPSLPVTSVEGYTGTWSPSTIDTSVAGTATYTFNPDITAAGQSCAISSTVTVTINPQTVPTFNPVAAICVGAPLSPLTTTSIEGITGTWSPSLDNTTTTTYHFTPDAGQCATTTTTLTITVSSQIVPTFNPIATICGGTTAPLLPLISLNGVTGTWSPSVIDTTVAGTFPIVFTPDASASACAVPTTIYVTVSTVPTPTVSVVTQPTCAVPTGTIQVTSPLGTTGNLPTNLFISEVTDATTGSLTYVELFNGTGAPIDLANYKLKFYNNGNTTASCDLVLSGIIANNTTNVIKVSSDANQGGVIPNQSFNGCGGVNTNDNIRLTTIADVIVDNWGRTDGVDYTPNNAAGYVYRRLANANPLPNPTWNPADWNAIAPEDYSDVGHYAPFTASTQYVYNVDGGAYQSGTTFTGLTPGTHTVTAQDTTTGCISAITTVTINPIPNTIVPTFTAVAAICNGDALTALPTTSTNVITGTWAPPLDNTVTTTYTFTPNAGQCATTTTLTITVNQPVTPTFNAVAVICNGDALVALPTTSTNLITGTWAPALNNTATTTYTFTPASGQCATTTTLTITVNQPVTPTFTAVAAICNGDSLAALPTTSTNLITGTWAPALNNTATTTYTFTPASGQCATTTTLTITVNQPVTPTFNAVAAICSGSTLSALPTTSINGFNGTWTPPLNNTATTTYTFTPASGQCATTTTLTITVNQPVTPNFNSVAAICKGDVLTALPTTSTDLFTGTWAPALNNNVTTTYTFTPTSGQCATTTTLSITVNQPSTPTFTAIAPLCGGAVAPALPGSSNEGVAGSWLPSVINNTQSGTYVFTPNAGQCYTTGSLSVTIANGFDFTLTDGCLDNNFTINVVPTNNSFDANVASYSWSLGSTPVPGTDQSLNVTSYINGLSTQPQLPLTFSVLVTDSQGCTQSHSVLVDRIYCEIQKGISPNGDGNNEFFDLRLMNVSNLEIFNRYGTKVYSKSSYSNEWSGQDLKGNELPDGTYYYMIEFSNNQDAKTGWIYINRQAK